MEVLQSQKQRILLVKSQNISSQISHLQVILEEYTNGDEYIQINATYILDFKCYICVYMVKSDRTLFLLTKCYTSILVECVLSKYPS